MKTTIGKWKKYLGSLLLALVLGTLVPGTFVCAADGTEESATAVPVRGIVEGFYGTPWTQAERLDMLKFCQEVGFNAYLYAPKDDPYHREMWRESYPADKLQELTALVRASQQAGVHFIFAVSPGLDLNYQGLAALRDRRVMLDKLDALYAVGVRDFAIFFDDIQQKNGAGQAEFLRAIWQGMKKRHADLGTLYTVPTEYTRAEMISGGAVTDYTRDFSRPLLPEICVLYTGEGVATGNLTAEQLAAADAIYGRKLGLWWNYPVNDYQQVKLALGPIEKLPLADVPAVFFNPMQYAELSKISLATGAALARNPAGYEPEKAWRTAIERQYGALAPEAETVAAHSQHLENSWASIGPADAPALRAQMEELWQSYPRGVLLKIRLEKLRDAIGHVDEAAQKLAARTPETTPGGPQLAQLHRLCAADTLGIDLLLRQRAGEDITAGIAQLEAARTEIREHENEARISDKCLRAFLDEILLRLE